MTDMKMLICSKQGIKINYVNMVHIMSDDGVCGGRRGSRRVITGAEGGLGGGGKPLGHS